MNEIKIRISFFVPRKAIFDFFPIELKFKPLKLRESFSKIRLFDSLTSNLLIKKDSKTLLEICRSQKRKEIPENGVLVIVLYALEPNSRM